MFRWTKATWGMKEKTWNTVSLYNLVYTITVPGFLPNHRPEICVHVKNVKMMQWWNKSAARCQHSSHFEAVVLNKINMYSKVPLNDWFGNMTIHKLGHIFFRAFFHFIKQWSFVLKNKITLLSKNDHFPVPGTSKGS